MTERGKIREMKTEVEKLEAELSFWQGKALELGAHPLAYFARTTLSKTEKNDG